MNRGARRAAPWLVAVAVASLAGFRFASAQAWNYPAFQQSHVVSREFVFGVADGGNAGTDLLFQWREGIGPLEQLSLDAGFAVPKDHRSGIGFFGGQYGYQLTSAIPQLPIEMLGVGGFNVAFGGGNVFFRIPVGVSVGHKFAVGGEAALTPFALPRIGLDFCNQCGTARHGRAELGVGTDLGLNLDLTSRIALRFAAGFGGTTVISRDDTFGFALAWSPPALLRH
jgi:hypothetical protein